MSFEGSHFLGRFLKIDTKWVFPKIMVPPNHLILKGFSIIFTIHFGYLFLKTSNVYLSLYPTFHQSPLVHDPS